MVNEAPRTLFRKIWDSHIVNHTLEEEQILSVDLHLINEVTSPQAFEALRLAGRTVRRPDLAIAVSDHNIPTLGRALGPTDPESRLQIDTLEKNTIEFEIPHIPLDSEWHGIIHVSGPELGLTLPGMTIVCGDSHTSTHGAFGALAFGIGTSEVEHVLATQTLRQKPALCMLIQIMGALGRGVTAKDLILAIINRIGTAGATGHVIEYAGAVIEDMDMEGRMTVCNMSTEAGARAGLIAPDATTYNYLRKKHFAPTGSLFDQAINDWQYLRSDEGANYDTIVTIDASEVAPMVTWGTTPEAVTTIEGTVPDPAREGSSTAKHQMEIALEYMGLKPGQPLAGLPIDVVFIGSCTNGRLDDLRSAAAMIKGQTVKNTVRAMVVPGSSSVKAQAESEGLQKIFMDAGFEWRESGCSMCLGMNQDQLGPNQRCASTSNRNFEGRQGPGGRTHLLSPAMAAAAAIHGMLIDIRTMP